MIRRRKNYRFASLSLLLASLLFNCSLPLALPAQETASPPPPPLRRMRRKKGELPKAPASRRAASAAVSQTSSEDDEVVRVDTELANILLTAIDKDQRFVTTLKREDVRVVEDGAPQEVSIFERETDLPLTLSVLIDTSRSQEKILPDEKRAARTFIDSVIRPDKDQAAIISFTGEAVLQEPLTNDLGRLRSAVERVLIELPADSPECGENTSSDREPRCYTGVWDALWVTSNEVLSQTPERARRAIILLSDGDDTSSTTKRQEAIDLAVKNNVVIYSIGIHDEGSEGELADDALKKVSEKTGGRAFFPLDKQSLEAAFAQIQSELRSQYLIAYQPSNRKHDGSFRQVRVEIVNPELRKQKLRLLYRQGYYAAVSAPSASAPAPPKESRPK
ncbi:MAG TPA: VWA domain-containing protein [Pyrinomonadaceae bacterium]|jgi:VWFA-related protein|nr:VWA domain-containing protein [Pyrinomonadaceae bacterium]